MARLAALGAAAAPAVLLAGCGAGSSAQAAAGRAGAIEVVAPWVPAPASPDVAALYLTLRNGGGTMDRLVGVSTPAASLAAVHSDDVHGTMTPTGALAVPPHAAVVLAPGHDHVMLEQLRGPLRKGQTITVTLRFARGGQVTVRVPVLATGAAVTGSGAM